MYTFAIVTTLKSLYSLKNAFRPSGPDEKISKPEILLIGNSRFFGLVSPVGSTYLVLLLNLSDSRLAKILACFRSAFKGRPERSKKMQKVTQQFVRKSSLQNQQRIVARHHCRTHDDSLRMIKKSAFNQRHLPF